MSDDHDTKPATPADLARILDLIGESSLGTPGARQLQQRTSDEELEHIRGLAEDEREIEALPTRATPGWKPTFVFEGQVVEDGDQLRQKKDGRWASPVPTACRNGHPFGAGKVTLGSQACMAVPNRSHRTYRCEACGDVVFVPPATAECDHIVFDGRGRGERGGSSSSV